MCSSSTSCVGGMQSLSGCRSTWPAKWRPQSGGAAQAAAAAGPAVLPAVAAWCSPQQEQAAGMAAGGAPWLLTTCVGSRIVNCLQCIQAACQFPLTSLCHTGEYQQQCGALAAEPVGCGQLLAGAEPRNTWCSINHLRLSILLMPWGCAMFFLLFQCSGDQQQAPKQAAAASWTPNASARLSWRTCTRCACCLGQHQGMPGQVAHKPGAAL